MLHLTSPPSWFYNSDVLVVGGSNSKMWFPSFQSINFGKVVHTYYRSKEAVNLCRRSSFRGIIWWDFVRKKYPEIIKKRKERIYAIMLADSLESLVGKIISYNTCILFLALIFFISRTYWVLFVGWRICTFFSELYTEWFLKK